MVVGEVMVTILLRLNGVQVTMYSMLLDEVTNNQEPGVDMTDEVTAILKEFENAGIIVRTGEMRWAELSCEWQPVYVLTELGRALSKAGIDPDDYLNGVKS